jgi:hypothetical protein
MLIPFFEQGEAAVCARVFYQWVRLTYRSCPKNTPAGEVITKAIEAWPLPAPNIMRMAQFSMLHYVGRLHMASGRWRYAAIERDRMGMSFRSALYFEYKAGRGHDPRVTNRGVRRRL